MDKLDKILSEINSLESEIDANFRNENHPNLYFIGMFNGVDRVKKLVELVKGKED